MSSIAEQFVSDFFSEISGDYDASILSGCPVYEEFLAEILDHLWIPADKPITILELGCGTGNLTRLLAKQFPHSAITTVDISQEMLNQTQAKLSSYPNQLTLVASDFNDLAFDDNQFDLVISSIALHHLLNPDKAKIYQAIYRWLKPGGKFRCGDECLSLPEDQGLAQDFERWKVLAKAKGATDEQLKMWIDHAEAHDHYAPVSFHVKALEAAGFAHVDFYWRKLFWAAFGGEKS